MTSAEVRAIIEAELRGDYSKSNDTASIFADVWLSRERSSAAIRFRNLEKRKLFGLYWRRGQVNRTATWWPSTTS